MSGELASKAEKSLRELEDAVVELLRLEQAAGLTNAEISSRLRLNSSYMGQHRNYLSLSLLGILIDQGRVRVAKASDGRGNLYYPADEKS